MNWNQLSCVALLTVTASVSVAACSSPTVPSSQSNLATQGCTPNSALPCPCPEGQTAMQVCAADGSGYAACPACATVASGGGDVTVTGGVASGTGGAVVTGGVVPVTGGVVSTGGVTPVSTGGDPATTGGMVASTGGAAATGGDSNASGSVSGISDSELEMLRQLCVDEINMYRASLAAPPAPLQRATSDRELCSDQGAKKDADSGNAHSSAGTKNPCNTTGSYSAFPNFTAQNTCPGYTVGGFGGSATIADALKQCLAQMWAEGEPPEGTAKCISDYQMGNTACFLAHGHWINMSGDSAGVSCGFYDMGSSKYWMNQDFF